MINLIFFLQKYIMLLLIMFYYKYNNYINMNFKLSINSFNVFDTLLARKTENPHGIFNQLLIIAINKNN